MAKEQNKFTCATCHTNYSKWSGQCLQCESWGTIHEETITSTKTGAGGKATPSRAFIELTNTAHAQTSSTGLPFLDRVLSGGLVAGSVTLLGGEPGIGKSTLLSQLILSLGQADCTCLYVAGEESPTQIAARLSRLQAILPSSLRFLDQTDASVIAATMAHEKPSLTIVDSIQTIRLAEVVGEPGNPTQMKACAALLADTAKHHNLSIILVGQVTKDGELAGPRLLEHLVDTVLMIEGDRSHALRILRPLKHRFGSTEESALLSLDEHGLKEIADPSATFLAQRPAQTSGSIATCLLEGSRPILVEIQALVTPAAYGTPTRRVSGVDTNRVNLILAVLTKRGGIKCSDHDVFVNVVGGIEARDPSIDLAIAMAIVSAKLDFVIPAQTVIWGELGLAGEIRPVPRHALRSKEAARMGFSTVISNETTKHVHEIIKNLSKN